MKQCTKCGVRKPVSEFSVDRGYLRPACKACRVVESTIYAKSNSEAVATYKAEWFQENKPRIRKKRRDAEYGGARRETNNAWKKKDRSKLGHSYVRGRLLRRGFDPKDVTPGLIRAGAALIKLKRKIKEVSK